MSPRKTRRGGGIGPRLAAGLGSLVLAPRASRRVASHETAPAPTRGGASRGRARDATGDHLASVEDLQLEREVMRRQGLRLGDLVLRHRRELAPFGVAGGLTLVATTAHESSPASWPLALLLGAGAVVACHLRARTPPQRLYAVAVAAGGSVLLAAGWAQDVTHVWFALALGAGTVLAGVPWWRHALPRAKLVLRSGQGRTVRQQAQAVVDAWPEIAAARGIPGVKLQRVEPDEHGWTMRLRIPTTSSLVARHVAAAVEGLETSFRTRPGGVRVEKVRDRADVVLVRVNLTDPLAKPVEYPEPGPGRSIADPACLGKHEDGSDVLMWLLGAHALMAGATGAGKTVLQRVLTAELLSRSDVVVWGVDVAKGGLAFLPYTSALGRLATTADEAVELLRAAIAVQKARAGWMGQHRVDPWPVSPEHPLLVVLVDELSDLLNDPRIKDLHDTLLKVGREQAVSVIGATQRASGSALGDSVDARAQYGIRIALKCNAKADGALILDNERIAEGWRPDRLPGKGALLIASERPEHQVPRPGRCFWLDVRRAERIAEAAMSRSVALEPWALQAAEDVAEAPGTAAAVAITGSGPKKSARARVLELLTAVGSEGVRVVDLATALKDQVSKSQIHRVLRELEHDGLAVEGEGGSWTLAGGGS